ncbi:cidABC operon transcriptional activator CidR [Cytobacillus purgationiresistens]|uniref:DNA-binding transcriptional LysR family regulator n=1 Tax=Cytobacillus purgationiresistens TaxID=863449 RepID=A0ABU0ANW2_9BACI|nr:LysR family transcriptional regulator [Cytobacillus purgationiresistens]MDQ0272421.1 DNA-binding transcriptional LysR family regulator [Cytobacillus purgationiresistens]
MDVQHLKYFVAVAIEGSFTKAAQKLYVTQPTISKMVKNIEEELGVVLFERTGKVAKLTDVGEVILAQAQNIIHSFDHLTSEINDLSDLKTGMIKIGLPPMVGASFFPQVIRDFYMKYPRIKIQLVEDGAKIVEHDIANGLLDLGVVVLPTNHDLFHVYPFASEHLQLLIHVSNPLSQKDSVGLSKLAGESFILFQKGFTLHDRIVMECVKAGFQPNVVYESSQWDFISGMVSANLGIALLPESICKQIMHPSIKVMNLIQPSIPWELGIIWRKNRYLSFAAKEWITFTQSFMNKEERNK